MDFSESDEATAGESFASQNGGSQNAILDFFTPYVFPKPQDAYDEIVAVTNELNFDLVYSAYLQGVFAWYSEDRGEPVVWWNPNPRFVLQPKNLHVSKSLEKFLKHTPYTYTIDTAFDSVIKNCASVKRPDQDGTWIGSEIIRVYNELHHAGVAHSVEVWKGEDIVGGFYGVGIGQIFFGESMFSLLPNTSKSAFVLFARKFFGECGGKLIDCQVYTDNLARFGAANVSRDAFLRMEKNLLGKELAKQIKDIQFN